MTESNDQLSFWEHLDELRGRIVRILLAVLVVTEEEALLCHQQNRASSCKS